MSNRSDGPPTLQSVSPEAIREYRALLTTSEESIDPKTWAGSFPAAYGIAPRVRIGANRWFNLLWLIPIGFVLLLVAVAVAKELRPMPAVQEFIRRHPGTGFATQFTTALPPWVRVQHFFNLFLMMFIIRAGLQILADHPRLYWTRTSGTTASTLTPTSTARCTTAGLRTTGCASTAWWTIPSSST